MGDNKWYLTVTYDEAKNIIRDNLSIMSRSFIAVGYYLKHIQDNEMYKQDGFDNIWDFAESNYGIKRSTASRWMDMNTRFSVDGNTPILAEQYKNFGKSQLQEMLYLDDKQIEEVTPRMTVKEIRDIRKPDVEEAEEEPISILGYPLRVYPEGSLLTTPGCGKQSCFSCHRDGCDLRQQYCYCVEAQMGNPFPCTTLNVADMLREEIGNSCQFVNEDLAYHRAGDGQPVPCCKKCNNKCGYACGRSNEKKLEKVIPEEENINDDVSCDVAQDEPAEVIHFTSDTTVDNAYGWTWSQVINEYLKNGYANPEKESTVDFLGEIYKVLKRAGVTVFYDENGNTLFDVTNGRLQEEYERAYGRKEDITAQDEQLPGQMEIHDYPGICPDETRIDELDLSVRTYNCLKRAGIDTIEQLRSMSDEELSKVRNFGKYNMDEVHKKLAEYDAEMEECAMPHNEEIVIENDDSVIEADEIVVEDADSVVEEELTEETTEDSDIQLVKKTLEKENRMLRDMRECYTEADWRVRRQKLLVGALANFMCELEEILDEEPEQEQPELPVMKNNEQRKEFIDNYMNWPIWLETKETGERYYRYNFENGTSFVIKVYFHKCFDYKAADTPWEDRYTDNYGSEEYYLLIDGKFFKDCLTNRSALAEHLKEVQKK